MAGLPPRRGFWFFSRITASLPQEGKKQVDNKALSWERQESAGPSWWSVQRSKKKILRTKESTSCEGKNGSLFKLTSQSLCRRRWFFFSVRNVLIVGHKLKRIDHATKGVFLVDIPRPVWHRRVHQESIRVGERSWKTRRRVLPSKWTRISLKARPATVSSTNRILRRRLPLSIQLNKVEKRNILATKIKEEEETWSNLVCSFSLNFRLFVITCVAGAE